MVDRSVSLSEDVQRTLIASRILPASRVGVDCSEGVVRLYGQVRTFYAKQLAQETARRVVGVRSVQNELSVVGFASR